MWQHRSGSITRRVPMVAAILLVVSCVPDRPTWQARLAVPAIARLEGTWTVELGVTSTIGSPPHRVRASGTLALVLNRERVTTSLLSQPPVAFGTYEVPFDSLGVSGAAALGTPDVWVNVVGDSVRLVLSPKSSSPITLRGVWRGDSLAGEWTTEQRAGPNGIGDFVLRRR
jgi:hypothetical protein